MKADKFTRLVHPETGKKRKVKNGISWTVVFFGLIALLFRRQFMAFFIFATLIAVIIYIDIYFFHIPNFVTIGIWSGYAVTANDHLLRQLLKQGYEVQNQENDEETVP